MPEALTKSWEKSIKDATKDFVSNLMLIYKNKPQEIQSLAFKRGATRFIAKRQSTDQSEE